MIMGKSKQPASRKKPARPLDDPRWISLKLAHHIRSEQLTGARYSDLATPDLIEALERETLISMRRNMATGEREELPGSFWLGRRIRIVDETFQIYAGQETPQVPRLRVPWEFYVWRPNVDTLWLTAQGAKTEQNVSRAERPGPATTHDWKMLVAREVIRRLMTGLKFPRAPEMGKFCKGAIGYEPDDSDIRKHLRFLREQ